VRVLVSSGYTPNEEIQGILDEGILGVLHKPYSKTVLEDVILTVMATPVGTGLGADRPPHSPGK
jgi:DNA-binding NarL/FixJ family response regulator